MRHLLSVVLLFVFTASANAQWLYQEQGQSAFSDQKVHLLLSLKQGKGLGVRCQNGTNELMFILPEQIDQISTVNALQPKLLFRVDSNAPHELSATAFDRDGQLLLMSETNTALIEEIRDAKQRIAVLMDLAGNQFAETRYSARGSTNAANKLLKNCKTAIE